MALEQGVCGIGWFFENRPLEIEPNYSQLLLSAETDYQTALIFCISWIKKYTFKAIVSNSLSLTWSSRNLRNTKSWGK